MGSMPEKDRITFSMALEELFARVLAEYGVNVVFKGRLSEYIAILDVEHDEYEEDLLSVAEHLQARIRSEMKLDTMSASASRSAAAQRTLRLRQCLRGNQPLLPDRQGYPDLHQKI